MSANKLIWHFEAFRRYLNYESMIATAGTLLLFDGEQLDPRNPRMQDMLSMLVERTDQPWLPERTGEEEINFNTEGDIFRNKGRLLSSLFIALPKNISGNKLVLLDFGKNLGLGRISRQQYYDYIIQHFKYPHPAYEDNFREWTSANKTLYPLIYILEVLVCLFEKEEIATLTVSETAEFLYPISDHGQIENVAQAIIKSRKVGALRKHVRTDEVDRKISDMFGFLCMTSYCYYQNTSISLNLVDVHSQEKTYYWLKRGGGEYTEENKLERIKELRPL